MAWVTKKYYIISEKAFNNDDHIYSLPSYDSHKEANDHIDDLFENNEKSSLINEYGAWVGIQVIKHNSIRDEKSTGVLDKFYI